VLAPSSFQLLFPSFVGLLFLTMIQLVAELLTEQLQIGLGFLKYFLRCFRYYWCIPNVTSLFLLRSSFVYSCLCKDSWYDFVDDSLHCRRMVDGATASRIGLLKYFSILNNLYFGLRLPLFLCLLMLWSSFSWFRFLAIPFRSWLLNIVYDRTSGACRSNICTIGIVRL
jgi:hypothetical protein